MGGQGPAADDEWWPYEKQLTPPDEPGLERIAYEMGELAAAELAKFMPQWRERYEHAIEPDFSYRNGDGWIEGAAAWRAEYRWARIPREVIKKWNAQRARAKWYTSSLRYS
jgi:hypothetical protein